MDAIEKWLLDYLNCLSLKPPHNRETLLAMLRAALESPECNEALYNNELLLKRCKELESELAAAKQDTERLQRVLELANEDYNHLREVSFGYPPLNNLGRWTVQVAIEAKYTRRHHARCVSLCGLSEADCDCDAAMSSSQPPAPKEQP